MARKIEIDDQITVGALAELLELPVSKLIGELFKNGVMATINEKIDFDTAQIIVGELDIDTQLSPKQHVGPTARPKREISAAAEVRAPVVAVMGHVDHGKTSLLDAIREAEVAKGEAGGITQHLSAYQIEHSGRPLTFIDTPGHEAFAALREHGARLTDLVLLVVAADEGVKPQTVEAIRFARGAGVKIIVAANKMDKSGADINRLKQQLSENELMPEDWGGETIIMPVSAKTKEGLNELLDMVLLVADVEELRAPSDGPAEGVVIEAHMEQGRGPIATGLIESGSLKTGDFLVAGNTYAKVKNLEDTVGTPLKSAGPSTPVIIAGFKSLPDFGEEFVVVADEKSAKNKATLTANSGRETNITSAASSSELLKYINKTSQLQELNILIKADVQGSLTSVADSLKALATDEVAVRIVGSGVGVITESDIHLAATTKAIIYGFSVEVPPHIKKLAQRDGVSIRLFKIIYELIDDAKKEMETLLAPEVSEQSLGELSVKGIFKIAKTEVIAGGEVIKGKLSLPALAKLYREKKLVANNMEVVSLQRGPQDVKEVITGEMCGFSLKTASRVEIKEDDRLQLFRRETKIRTL